MGYAGGVSIIIKKFKTGVRCNILQFTFTTVDLNY